MKKIIDNIDSTTGWSASAEAVIYGTNEFEEFRAGNTSASLVVEFSGENSYVEKTYSEDITGYTSFIIWVSSRTKGSKTYKTASDYSYKIELATGQVFYLPVMKDFYWVHINVSDIDTLEKIKITSLHGDTDHLILNYSLVCTDDFPLDLFQGIKDELEYLRDNFFSFDSIDTIVGIVGNNYIDFTVYPEFLDRYAVVDIDDGTNSEVHQVVRVDGKRFYFGPLFDGETLLNDYNAGEVRIQYPILFGTLQKEIALPAITLWGFESDRQMLVNELDHIIDSVKTDDTFQERQVGQYLLWDILLDCETKEELEPFSDIVKIVRMFIGKRKLWVNGRRCNIELTGPPTELYPTESYDIIPKIQFPVNVSIREELYAPKILPKTSSVNFTTSIK